MDRHTYFTERLNHLGMFDSDSDYNGLIGQYVERMSQSFKDQRHSGGSAASTLGLFNQLMQEWESQQLQPCKPR